MNGSVGYPSRATGKRVQAYRAATEPLTRGCTPSRLPPPSRCRRLYGFLLRHSSRRDEECLSSCLACPCVLVIVLLLQRRQSELPLQSVATLDAVSARPFRAGSPRIHARRRNSFPLCAFQLRLEKLVQCLSCLRSCPNHKGSPVSQLLTTVMNFICLPKITCSLVAVSCSIEFPREPAMKQGHELTKVHSRMGAESAILFLHGFTGDADETWDRFPFVLGAEESLGDWDILSLGYHTSFLPGTRGIWSADPELPILAILLGTQLTMRPLSGYSQVAVIAHSMGGLIAQQALVDNPGLIKLVRHLFLFGTPSAGLRKAAFITSLLGLLVGDQVHNMASDGEYIKQLRLGWTQVFGNDPPFKLYVIAGDKDQFVPPESSLQPFARKYQRVVVGDHVSMVKPRDRDADAVRLIVSGLTELPEPQGPSSPLRAAAELGPMAPQGLAIAKAAAIGEQVFTTQPQVVEAALALDRDNQQADAIALLEKYRHLGTDVVGTLAGRIKRRWLQDGKTEDAEWALSLYETALNINCSLPETPETIDQIFYHAINVAFLKQVAFDQSEQAKSMAQLALAYARKRVPPDVWSVATQAEAFLYLGDYQEGLAKYQEAISLRPETWKLLSTGQQAQQIASRLGRHDLQDKLKTLFDPPPARANKIFVSYSHKDSEWRGLLELVLRPLMTGTDRLDFWADTRIQPGADWLKEISYALATSRVVVLLVSAEFLASDFVRNHELPVVLNAADRGRSDLDLALSQSCPVRCQPPREVSSRPRHLEATRGPFEGRTKGGAYRYCTEDQNRSLHVRISRELRSQDN